MMEALAPGFDRRELPSLGELEVGVAWTRARRAARARARRAAAELFPRRAASTFPLPRAGRRVFMREVADIHRGLYAEHAELYGENIRAKIELCLAVTDAEAEAGAAAPGGVPASGRGGGRGLDLLAHADARLRRRRRAGRSTRSPRRGDPLHLPVQRARLAGARAALRHRRDGLPASLQLVGRPGADALVLAAGAALEAAGA